MVAMISFVGTAAYALVTGITSNVNSVNVDDLINQTHASGSTPRDPDDPFEGHPVNILVMGIDLRDQENAAVAGADPDGGMRSDTTFLVHIPKNREYIELISFPRDALVAVPECQQPNGNTVRPQSGVMFNSAFSSGSQGTEDTDLGIQHGAACVINTVNNLTGITIDTFAVVKMNGVIDVVNTVGGVEMCFDEPVVGHKKYSPGVNFPAGRYTLNGTQALDYVRARKGKGLGLEMGSDLSRIQRQQGFVESLIAQAFGDKNLISSGPQLYNTIGSVLRSMVLEEKLARGNEVSGLLLSLRGLDLSKIIVTELPTVESSRDKNRVVYTSEAKSIWQRIIDDAPPASMTPPIPDSQPSADIGGPEAPEPPQQNVPGGEQPVDPSPIAPGPTQVTTPVPPAAERLPGVCYPGWELGQ